MVKINQTTVDASDEPAAKKQKTNEVASSAKTGAKAAKISKKDVDAKLKHASEAELKAFIRGLATSHPDVIAETFPSFTPAKMPAVPAADDTILRSCFHCQGLNELKDFHGVKVCGACNADMYEHETMTKQKIINYFNFSDAEAKKLPHKTGQSFYSTYSMYNHGTVIKAAEKKHGSLYTMVLKNRRPSS